MGKWPYFWMRIESLLRIRPFVHAPVSTSKASPLQCEIVGDRLSSNVSGVVRASQSAVPFRLEGIHPSQLILKLNPEERCRGSENAPNHGF